MDLTYLEKIKRVDTPPFLFTRIQQKINYAQNTIVPKKIVWTISLAFIVILMLNVSIIVSQQTPSNTLESYAQSINLISNNNLYK